ncbi:hypothetical protein Salat_0457900 [Sesamum alatum]|uniref:Uncharacterized protein n=1 Tax=Sesamum alatum TaxID=300844 RepID=A0AAE2D0J0_9LAMI|nr:hypothetical protein Salat_0457900 [Sesamum alatum]
MSHFSIVLLLLVVLVLATPCFTRSVAEDSTTLDFSLSENDLTLDDEDEIWSVDATEHSLHQHHRAKPPKHSKPPKHGKPPKHSKPPKTAIMLLLLIIMVLQLKIYTCRWKND